VQFIWDYIRFRDDTLDLKYSLNMKKLMICLGAVVCCIYDCRLTNADYALT
jgi:hypothetical protein